MACTGSAPTFDSPSGWSLSSVSCSVTASINVSSGCGDTGYEIKLYRQVAGGGYSNIYSDSIPSGPLSGQNFQHTATPPCGAGNVDYYWEILCEGVVQSTSSTKTVSQGGDPTLSEHTLTPTSCSVAESIRVQSPCGNCDGTLKLYRKFGSSVTFDPGEVISTQAVPSGPYDATFSHTATPPCGIGTYYYVWRLTMNGSDFDSDEKTTSQGAAPTLSNDNYTHDADDCENHSSIRVQTPCGTCGGTIKLYRSQGAPTGFDPGDVIHTDTVNAGPTDQTFSYDDTPPCIRGLYYYQWRVEMTEGNYAGTQHSSVSGGAATVTFESCDLQGDCEVRNSVQISKPCGECAGTAKLFRNGVEVYSDTVPAGPLIGFTLNYNEYPGDGSWSYIWKVYNDAMVLDDESALNTVNPACNLIGYDPQNLELPEGEMEKHIVLVRVTRTGPRSYYFEDYKMLHFNEQRTEWWYHKNGGCGAFRLLTHEMFPDIMSSVLGESWEMHVRIKLGGETHYSTWYRGVIRAIRTEEQGAEQLTDARGYGYVEMLDNIQVQKKYPAGLTVKQIVDDIMDVYVVPNTRIVRPIDVDVTNGDSGVDDSPYVIKSELHFECSALKAIKFLAELQGDREFGVDADREFYFRELSTDVVKSFYDGDDILELVAGGKTFVQANEIKVAGKSFGAKNYLQVRADVTDISNNGVYETPVEVPWVTGDADAAHWADNIIAKSKGNQEWSIFEWKYADFRVEASHPIGKIRVYGADISNTINTYDVAKIQYIEGGWVAKSEIREMGQPHVQRSLDQHPLKAKFYLGYYPRDLTEELEIRLKEQVEFLKGRWKQFVYPNDVTNLPTVAHTPGELLHYSKDVTNNDVLNSSLELQDLTNPRGLLLSWLSKQWVKLSTRRTVTSLPARGNFIGEIVALVTDVTNGNFGEIYWWSGTAWSTVGSGGGGEGGGGGASLGSSTPSSIEPDDTGSAGVATLASREDHQHAIACDLAVDITNANAEGVSTAFSRADHKHKGIRTVKVKGQADIDGYVDITAGLYIRVTQSGQTLTFDVDDLVAYINTLALAAYNPITDPVFIALMG